jgi:hypothetical protein
MGGKGSTLNIGKREKGRATQKRERKAEERAESSEYRVQFDTI